MPEPKVWIPQLNLGLGLWQGEYQDIERLWMRWYDSSGHWIATDHEAVEIAQQRAETERQRAEQAQTELAALRQRLRDAGTDPDRLV